MGGYMNSKKAIVLIDRMGSEYQLSRIYKQTIFTKRKDLTEEMKAEIYMKMNQEREKMDMSVSGENEEENYRNKL